MWGAANRAPNNVSEFGETTGDCRLVRTASFITAYPVERLGRLCSMLRLSSPPENSVFEGNNSLRAFFCKSLGYRHAGSEALFFAFAIQQSFRMAYSV